MEQIQLTYNLPYKIFTVILILHKNPNAVVCTNSLTSSTLPLKFFKRLIATVYDCYMMTSTEPSIKGCASVNKWRTAEAGGHQKVILPVARTVWDSRRQDASIGTSLQTEGFAALSDPRLNNPANMRKKCCYGRERNLGQYSSPPLSPLISHRQQTSPLRK